MVRVVLYILKIWKFGMLENLECSLFNDYDCGNDDKLLQFRLRA